MVCSQNPIRVLLVDDEDIIRYGLNAILQCESAIEVVGEACNGKEAIEQAQQLKPDIVLMDPPRKGCDPAVLEALIAMKPGRIVYVSCNPATMARDLKVLCETGGYHIRRVQPVDFFPQTAHVECIAFLDA